MLPSTTSRPMKNRKLTFRVVLKLWMCGTLWLFLLLTVQGFNTKPGTTFQTVQMAVPPVVACPVEPFDLSEVKLFDSPFKQAMDLNAKYLLSLDPDRFLHYFRVNAGLNPKAPAYGGWESPTRGLAAVWVITCRHCRCNIGLLVIAVSKKEWIILSASWQSASRQMVFYPHKPIYPQPFPP